MRLRKTRFQKPYTQAGKTTFPERGKTGVYLIKEDGKLVYVGYSENDLYKTMYRHFQTWNHRQQPVVSYAGKRKEYTVRVVYTKTGAQAASLEKALIKKHEPRDCRNKYRQLELSGFDQKILNDYDTTLITPTSEAPF